MKSPKKLALWIVSHCTTSSRREKYVAELQKYMPVDVYGACGNLTASKDRDEETKLIQEYKFYLAFESATCRDYVTEKFFRRMTQGIVPVVFGGADYSRGTSRNHEVLEGRRGSSNSKN